MQKEQLGSCQLDLNAGIRLKALALNRRKEEWIAAPWRRGRATPGSWSSSPAPPLHLACKKMPPETNQFQTFIHWSCLTRGELACVLQRSTSRCRRGQTQRWRWWRTQGWSPVKSWRLVEFPWRDLEGEITFKTGGRGSTGSSTTGTPRPRM